MKEIINIYYRTHLTAKFHKLKTLKIRNDGSKMMKVPNNPRYVLLIIILLTSKAAAKFTSITSPKYHPERPNGEATERHRKLFRFESLIALVSMNPNCSTLAMNIINSFREKYFITLEMTRHANTRGKLF